MPTKNRRTRMELGLAFVFLAILAGASAMVCYYKLPQWKPEWVMENSGSPDRVLLASSFAFNGHFDATPILKSHLKEEFGSFLERKLYDPNESIKEQAACILAYSDDPIAEEALQEAYHRGQSEDMKLSLVFFLGWTATETSRPFLMDILEGRVKGPRWSALRALSMSSIGDRHDTIFTYLSDSDRRVREQAQLSVIDHQEENLKTELAKLPRSEIFSLALRLSCIDTSSGQLPLEFAGKKILWASIHHGVIDLRFDNDKTGILIGPSGKNIFPEIAGYRRGSYPTKGVTVYLIP